MNDVHAYVPTPSAEELQQVRERLYAFCFPNVPVTAGDREAFEQAVQLQYAHEAAAREMAGDVPPGVAAFRLGDFQVTMEEGARGGAISRKSICPAAYGLLLRRGLLYRGAEGRC